MMDLKMKRKIDRAADLDLLTEGEKINLFLAKRSKQEQLKAEKIYRKLNCDSNTKLAIRSIMEMQAIHDTQLAINRTQLAINRAESDLTEIMSIPAGADLIKWSARVRLTWWYRFFSMFSPTIREFPNR